MCDHRDASGRPMDTWYTDDHVQVCDKCVHGSTMRPIKDVAQMMTQMDFATKEMLAMTSMMREVGMEFVDDEVMGTAAQFEEFKRRWMELYPDRGFAARYGNGQ